MFRRLRLAAALSFFLSLVLTGTASAMIPPWRNATANNNYADIVRNKVIAAHARVCGWSDNFASDSRLVWAARYKAMDMGYHDLFQHLNKDGRMTWDYYPEAGIRYRGAGENIAWNNYPDDQTAYIAFNGWMNSPGHRAIIEDCKYDLFGVGVFKTYDGGTLSKWYVLEVIDTVDG